MESVDSLLKNVGVGRLPVNDPFFNDTYEACKVFQRTGITIEDDEEFCHKSMKEFQCSATNCDAIFRNLIDYEIHYNSSHRYTCEECKITQPNSRLLEIHIQENHDSFFEVAASKRSMYQCWVPECNEKFLNPDERKCHCTKIHKFPENFCFDSSGLKLNKARLGTEKILPSTSEDQDSALELGEFKPQDFFECSEKIERMFVDE